MVVKQARKYHWGQDKCSTSGKTEYAKGGTIYHIKSYQPAPARIDVWVYISSWTSFPINPPSKSTHWFSSIGLLIWNPLLPGAPGWPPVCPTLAHWFHHVAGAILHVLLKARLQTASSKRPPVWNEDSQTNAEGVVFRPVHVGLGQAQTFGFLDHMRPSTELKLRAYFKRRVSFIPRHVLVWSQNGPGSKLFFTLYALYVDMQTVLVIRSSHVLASGREHWINRRWTIAPGKHGVRFLWVSGHGVQLLIDAQPRFMCFSVWRRLR